MSTFDDAWNAGFDGTPSDSENVNLGAQRIRSLKVAVEQRMQVGHVWGDGLASASNDGKHAAISAVVQAADPTLDAGDGAFYVKTVNANTEAFYKDSAGNVLQLTAAGSINISTGTIVGNLSVSGQASIGTSLAVAGAATLGSLSVSGSIQAAANLTAGNLFQVTNTIDIPTNNRGVNIYTSSATMLGFFTGTFGSSVAAGSITTTGANVAYNTSSDYRLKENIEEINDPVKRLLRLKPKRFNYIGYPKEMEGFLAHEAAEVVPYAVIGAKDDTLMQQMDYARVVPLIVAALQQIARGR